jgi:(1->4)-alpha-D-glucan 1-alpha-D-glucosylmutase
LIARVLALRRRAPDLFAEGSYLPVQVQGDRAGSVVAFARRHGEQWLLAAVPRLPLALLQGADGIGLAPETWRGTVLSLESAPARPLVDALTGAPVESLDGPVPLARLCTTLPFVLLTTQG